MSRKNRYRDRKKRERVIRTKSGWKRSRMSSRSVHEDKMRFEHSEMSSRKVLEDETEPEMHQNVHKSIL